MAELTLDELREIVAMSMDLDSKDGLRPFGPDTTLYDEIGMDSLGAVGMVVELQRRFGVRLSEEEVPDLLTAGSILQRVNQGGAHK